MTDLRVSLVQTDLIWLDPQANRQQLQRKLASLAKQTDLVVLPEMFTSGFTTHPEDLSAGSATGDWMLDQARLLDAAVTGSIATAAEETNSGQPGFVNRMLFATPEGELWHYDKVHLFRMGNEHKRYQPGHKRCVLCFRGWRILLTVCYDLRFPVFCRNQNDYDLMLNVANWPDTRRHHWRTLLQARAIENLAYVVGVNRVGVDGKQLSYTGDSMAINFRGDILVDQEGEWLETIICSRQELQQYRTEFPAWQDADSFSLTLHQ